MGDKLERDIAAQPANSGLLKSGRRCPLSHSHRPASANRLSARCFKRSLMCLLACLRCSPPSLDPGAAMLLKSAGGTGSMTPGRASGLADRAGTWRADKRCVGGALLMNATGMRELYSSPNGDRWHLCKDESDQSVRAASGETSPRADKSPKSNCATSSREDMVRSNKPCCK